MATNPIAAYHAESKRLADDLWMNISRHKLQGEDDPSEYDKEREQILSASTLDHAGALKSTTDADIRNRIDAVHEALVWYINATAVGLYTDETHRYHGELTNARRRLEPLIESADRTADNSRKGKRKLLPEDENFMGAVNYIRQTKGKPGSRIGKVREYLRKEGKPLDMAAAIVKQIQRYREELKLT